MEEDLKKLTIIKLNKDNYYGDKLFDWDELVEIAEKHNVKPLEVIDKYNEMEKQKHGKRSR